MTPGTSGVGCDPPPPAQQPGSSWARQRRQDAAERARLLRLRQDAEHARAARIVQQFLRTARLEGLEPTVLRAQGYNGGTARTPLRGWYLRADKTVALGEDGSFYVLSMPLTLRQRLLGATPVAEPVPMTVGEGGRDGDVIPLRLALDHLLPGWEDRSPGPLV